MKTWTLDRINSQLKKELWLGAATQAALDAAAGPPFNLQAISYTFRQLLLASRELRDGYTGEATAAQPMPDFTTEAGMTEATKEMEEFNLFHLKQNDMLNQIVAENTKRKEKAEGGKL